MKVGTLGCPQHWCSADGSQQCLIPVVMSGIIAVYSLVISVLIAQDLQPPAFGSYSLFKCVSYR